jgi:hypothetical protein
MVRIIFAQGEDHDFYHRCYTQINFHSHMVLFPLVTMVLVTLLFVTSFVETLNYYNVRDAPHLKTNTSLAALIGCTDERAINYNPLAGEHAEVRAPS